MTAALTAFNAVVIVVAIYLWRVIGGRARANVRKAEQLHADAKTILKRSEWFQADAERLYRRTIELQCAASRPCPPPVHILRHGHALCGLQGPPSQWPPEHKWVRVNEDGATCVECVAHQEKLECPVLAQ